MTEITLKRVMMRPARPGGRPGGWSYSWTTPEDITWNFPDGTSRPGPRAGSYVSYGSGLDALRGMLRRKYPTARLIESWKS